MRWPRLSRRLRPAPQVFDKGCVAAFLVAVAIIAALFAASAYLSAAGSDVGAHGGPPDNAASLARCRSLGPDAGKDAQCQAAWVQARRAFFQSTEVSL